MSKIMYFDASCGVSGDMFVGALIDLGADFEKIKSDVVSLGLNVDLTAEKVMRRGIKATKFSVLNEKSRRPVDEIHPEHSHEPHRHLSDIRQIINSGSIEQNVKDSALFVFELIAAAEARVHDAMVESVHFHEVGAVDSIVDIVAAASAFHQFGVEAFSTHINVGSGTVICQHGELPVPVPAVVELLKGLPAYSDGTKTELATPTGVALLKYFCEGFGDMPHMRVTSSGYGAGTKDLEKPNALRVILGETV